MALTWQASITVLKRNYFQVNPLAVISPCACHSLNLCSHAAECCQQVQKFFGIVQKLYIFSSSPQRWENFLENIDCSLHSLSHTHWSDRVDSVKPFAAHIPGIRSSLEALFQLNLSSETKNDVQAILKCIDSFSCILLSSIWLKVLVAIDLRNKVLQAQNATLDIEVSNIKSLLEDLQHLRDQWPRILSEARLVAIQIGIKDEFPSKRNVKCKKFHDESTELSDNEESEQNEETSFKCTVFLM